MATALAGTAISAIGGALSKKSSDSANAAAAQQAEFNPFNINGAGGNVVFDENGQASVTGDANQQLFSQGFADNFARIQSGQAGNQGAIDFGNQIGNNFGQFFNEAGAAGDPNSAVNAANQFGMFSGQNAAFAQAQGQNQAALANMFGLSQGGRNEGLAQGMFGQAANAFGNTDFLTLQNQNLQAQRAAAQPGEERAVNSKFQNLFNRGVLSSSSGSKQLGDLAQAQEQADIQRVLGSQQFGNQLQQQNRMFGLNAAQQGQSFRGQDDQFNAQRASMFGNLGLQNQAFAQNAGGAGMNAAFAGNNLVNTRGQQRLANAAQIFGFGQQAQNQNFGQQIASFQGSSQGNADLRNLIALGGNLGSAGAQAGANQGRFTSQTGGSAVGSFLQGIGESSFFQG